MRAASTLTVAFFCALFFFTIAAGQEAAETPPRNLREQSIYIPYDKLQETFEREGRGVFVPYERFQELWKAARQRDTRRPESRPPVQAMITEIDSLARVAQDVVRVEATARIDLLAEGWLTVPLRLADAAVLSATIDEQPARLITQEDGGQALLLKKQGAAPEQIVLRLEYAKGFTKAPGRNSVSFQAPLAPVNRWQIRVPDPGVKVNVHPMLASTEAPVDEHEETVAAESEPKRAAETVVWAFVGAAPEVNIDWTPRAEGAMGLEALVSVQTDQLVVIDEGITRARTTLAYEISRSELTKLVIETPADQKVVNVSDANVRGWQVETVGDVQKITVDLFQPARTRQAVVVELERFRDDQQAAQIDVPIVRAVGVGRQRGIVVVQLADGLRAEPGERSGLSQLDLSEVPGPMKQRNVALAYRYAALPFDLQVRVERLRPRILADQLVEALLEPRKLTYLLLAKLQIQRAGVFELQCSVPDGFEVRDVRGQESGGAQAAVVESFALDPEDSSRLKINLGAKAEGDVGLLVEWSREIDEPNLLTPTGENVELVLDPPRFTGEFVVRSTGRLVVFAPESLRTSPQNLTGLRSISFAEAFEDIPSVAGPRTADLRPALAFAFSGDAVSAQVDAQRRQPQVTARQLLIARIDPNVVKYEATFFFNIRYSGVEALRVDVPAALVGGIRNETRELRELPFEPQPDDVADGYTALSFAGDTEQLGDKQFKLTWEEPIENLGVGASVDLVVPRLVPRDVARADGQVVLVKAETIDVRPRGVAEGLDPIDPEIDLMAGASVPDAAGALEFRDENWDLTLTATRYQLELLKHTSIERAVLRMVVTRSNRVAVQALYRLRSNMQRLELELPDDVVVGRVEFDTEPARINGRAVTLERGEDARSFFVPLVGYATNEPLLLELRYTTSGSAGELRYPTFPNEPAVQRVDLIAYIPAERDYIGSQGPWTAEMAWNQNDLFQRRYAPTSSPNQLIGELVEGIEVVGNPASDFPVDGKPLLFATLRPVHPDDGALKVSTIDAKVLDAVVLVGFLTLGVVLLARPYVQRLMAVCGLVGVLISLGVFMPALAGQVVDQTLAVAAIMVALLWFAVSATRVVPLLGQFNWRLGFARAGAGGTAAAAMAPASFDKSSASSQPSSAPASESPPPANEDAEEAEGGEHHG